MSPEVGSLEAPTSINNHSQQFPLEHVQPMPLMLHTTPADDGTDISIDLVLLDDISTEHHYEPLDKEIQIRLVQIQPSRVDSDPIQLTVRHVNLEPDDLSMFAALSYVWGNPMPTHRVHIKGQNGSGWLSVRQGLYDFLCTARSLDEPSSWCWIDQICINQEDDVEKGHQVNRMAQIYLSAKITIMWLGPGFEGSDEAIDLIFEIGEQQDVQRAFEQLGPKISFYIKSLTRIIQNPYWTRLWVLQEIILGKNAFVVQGPKLIPWNSHFKKVFENTYWEQNTEIRPATIIKDKAPTPISPNSNWDRAARFAATLRCHDVRDKVFGQLGIVHSSLRFRPDYSLTCHDLLLLILRKTLEYLQTRAQRHAPYLSLLESAHQYTVSMVKLALLWCIVFSAQNQRIDMKAIRRFLRREAFPVLYSLMNPGSRIDLARQDWRWPRVKIRARLRWDMPNTGSRRWDDTKTFSPRHARIARRVLSV